MKSAWNCTTSQKIICFSVHQLYSMQLGITLKIVALSTSDLKITYGVLFYMLEIVCIVKCGGKMHIWCLLACKKVSRDEEEGKFTSFLLFCVSCGNFILGQIFLSQLAEPWRRSLPFISRTLHMWCLGEEARKGGGETCTTMLFRKKKMLIS